MAKPGTRKLLDQAVEDGIYGIGSYMTEEEAEKKEHLAGPFSFIAESDGYTSFADAWTGPVCGSLDSSDYRTGHATHGHLPDRGPQPPLFLFGPGIREKAVPAWTNCFVPNEFSLIGTIFVPIKLNSLGTISE